MGWSFPTFKAYVDQRFSDQDKAVNAALSAAEKAVGKAEVAAEKRFDAVNEFRSVLNDQQQNLVTRNEYDQSHRSLVEKVDDLSARVDRNEGRGSGFSTAWGVLVAGVGVIATLYLLFHK
jgi:hypothetical protein